MKQFAETAIVKKIILDVPKDLRKGSEKNLSQYW